MSLTPDQIDGFLTDGFVRLDDAFPRALADEMRVILWRDTGCDPDDSKSWEQPVVRLGHYSQPPFVAAANTPRLTDAYDALVGPGVWQPPGSLGTFPVRFPSKQAPGDDGWHVESAFQGPDAGPFDYMKWRVNLASKGRTLLMLFLVSDIGPDDAPTRIRVGSHNPVARMLEPYGEAGLGFMDLAGKLGPTEGLPETLATGPAGTVYLCHPFLVHAAQPHHGKQVRFMAQPPLMPLQPFDLSLPLHDLAPVPRAIRLALRPGDRF